MRARSLVLLAVGASAAPPTSPPATGPSIPIPFTGKSYDEIAPAIQPAAIIIEKPLIKANAKRQLVRYGPFDLPALKLMAPGAMEHGHGGGIMSGDPIKGMNIWALLRGDFINGIASMLDGSMDPEGTQVSKTLTEGICKDCSILSSKIDAVFENGTRADLTSGVYLHHIIAINGGTVKTRQNNLFNPWVDFCAGGGFAAQAGMSAISGLNWISGNRKPDIFAFGAVDEFRQWFTTPDGSMNSGFYRGPDDMMFTQAELINYRPEPQKVYLQFDIEFVPGKLSKNAVTMFTSATDCDKGIGFMGKGVGNQTSSNALTINADGLILSARGHMHDGGETMTVSINEKQFCVSKAEYGTSYERASPSLSPATALVPAAGGDMASMHGHGRMTNATEPKKAFTTISKMSDCLATYPVKKGDKMKLVAHYNLDDHPLRESGGEAQMQMGLVAFTWVPS